MSEALRYHMFRGSFTKDLILVQNNFTKLQNSQHKQYKHFYAHNNLHELYTTQSTK